MVEMIGVWVMQVSSRMMAEHMPDRLTRVLERLAEVTPLPAPHVCSRLCWLVDLLMGSQSNLVVWS